MDRFFLVIFYPNILVQSLSTELDNDIQFKFAKNIEY